MQIQLRLKDDENRPVNIDLAKNSTKTWRSTDIRADLEITITDTGGIDEMKRGPMIASEEDEIAELFLMALSQKAQVEAAGVEYEEEASFSSDTPFPYDPDAIRIDTKQFNIGLIHEMINEGDINLSPDFQRQFVWTDLGTRSRLIESIMLRIPLPVFYMAQDSEGRLHVVDGLQRLTVINQFLNSELRLRDLEYLKEEIGKVFRHEDPTRCINQKYRKRILQTQILVNIIDPQTPSEVKFDIFKRINQGGRPLNSQEMRNCMSINSTRALVTSLAKGEDFLKASDGSVGTIRMQDQELIVRFLAFRLLELGIMPAYSGNMEAYLDKAIDALNSNEYVHRQISDDFCRSMKNNHYLFGKYAFRKCLPTDLNPGKRRRLINNSYFTTWSVVLATYKETAVAKVEDGALALAVANRLEIDNKFREAVTTGTNDRRRLEYAFQVAKELCREIIG